jgi:hypothetical protein
MLSRYRWTWAGLAFGLVLLVFALGDAGAGHGTDLPFIIFSAPFVPIPPLLWACIGGLLDRRSTRPALILLGIHTVWAVPLTGYAVLTNDYYLTRFAQAEPEWLWSGFAVYALGLIATWSLAITQTNRVEPGKQLE